MSTIDDLDLLRRAVADATRVIDGIGPSQLDAPTPCPEFTVSQLLEHLLLGDGMYVSVLDPDGDPPGEEWRVIGPRLVAAAQRPIDPDEPITLNFGTFTRAGIIQMALLETAVHAADLAWATGQAIDDDEVYERIFDLIRDEWRMEGVLDPAVPCDADAPLVQRVLAYAGRAVVSLPGGP